MAIKNPSSPHSRKLSRTERGPPTPARSPGGRRGLSKPILFILAFLLLYVGRWLRSKLTADDTTLSHLNKPLPEWNSSLVHASTSDDKTKIVNLGPLPEYDFRGTTELVDFLESGSVAAILPVTETTLPSLRQILDPLLQDHSSISEVTLLCRLELFPPISKMLRDGRLDMDVDIQVVVWPSDLGEGQATIRAVSSLTSEYVLVLESNGLSALHEEARDLFVTQPFLLDMPTGLCGASFLQESNHTLCVKPFADPKPVSFALPPFFMPTSSLKGFNTSVDGEINFWMQLGRGLLHADGIGAFIRRSDKSHDRVWCHDLCQKLSISTEEPALQQCPSIQDDATQSDDRSNLANSTTIAIIMPTLGDLNQISSTICAFIHKGLNLRVLVLSEAAVPSSTHEKPFPWIQDHFISGDCELLFSTLHLSSNSYANAEAVDFWLGSQNETASVIVYVHEVQERFNSAASMISQAIDMHREKGVTVIKIPQNDLSSCDWMGTLSIAELHNWNVPHVELSVITYDRPESLKRLLTSLQNALYFGDTVDIRINIEHTGDLDTMQIVNDFKWAHGHKFVHHRVVHAGLLTAVVESWFPHSRHSYGVLLEDDVEVSRLYYAWIKMALLRYRYGDKSNKRTSMFGISLYQQKQIELLPEGRRPFDAQDIFDSHSLPYPNTPYLSQIPCSWGAVYFPEHWKEFHSYLQIRFSETWLPIQEMVVPHVRSNKWAKSWKRFFIELVYLRGYVMLYPNYDDFVSLSTNHLELGSHVKAQPKHIFSQKKALFTLPLMHSGVGDAAAADDPHTSGLLDLPEHELPSFTDLPILDLMGTLSTIWEIEMRGRERQEDLIGCATIASRTEHQKTFEALELFTCNSVVSEDEAPVNFGPIDMHDHEDVINN